MLLSSDLYDSEKIERSPGLGLEAKDINNYSVSRVLRAHMRRAEIKDGLEAELSREIFKRGGGRSTDSFNIPLEVLAGGRMQRDMTVGSFGNGGAMVGFEIGDYIPLMRNSVTALRLGATVLTGLRSPVGFPRQTSSGTPQSLPETAPANASTPTVDQPTLNPKRVATRTLYSKQLLIQSSPSIENFLRDDLMAQMLLRMDYLIYYGSGSNSEPLGITATPGIGSLAFGGPVSWGAILNFESALANMNADVPGAKIAFVTTPQSRNKWKQTAQALIGATTVSAKPIWETMLQPDGSNDGICNGYRAAATNQILNNQAIYGDFKKIVVGMFGEGIELLPNPYTYANQGEIEVNVGMYFDVMLRNPQAFCVSSDAGNQ
jgi:HK97 family phage major capsid protein